ncbi:GGDEF domain-containing protein [Peptococcaceae bacterium 1198_IL3148]
MTTNDKNNHLCPLTGLLNCGKLQQIVTKEVALARNSGTALSLIMIDIDHLDLFNKTYGYAQGDKVLVRLSEIIKANKRADDTIVRCHSADFAITLRDTNLSQAYLFAQRILDIVENEIFIVAGKEVKVTASAGISELSKGMDVEKFLKAADATLRYAKHCGRNRVKGTL